MTSSSHATHLPALAAPHERDEVGAQLQVILVELIDLSLLGKQLHWNVVGAQFRALHLQLDELVDSWRSLADLVAERSVALGVAPDGQSATVAASTTLKPVPRGELESRVVIRELTTRVAGVAERTREQLERLGELDPVSQDVVIGVLRALEEQLWMLRAQSGGGA